jgi:hypothetical protein
MVTVNQGCRTLMPPRGMRPPVLSCSVGVDVVVGNTDLLVVHGRRRSDGGARSWLTSGDLGRWYRRTLQLHDGFYFRMLLICGIDEDWES